MGRYGRVLSDGNSSVLPRPSLLFNLAVGEIAITPSVEILHKRVQVGVLTRCKDATIGIIGPKMPQVVDEMSARKPHRTLVPLDPGPMKFFQLMVGDYTQR